jgi:hypothetical protein
VRRHRLEARTKTDAIAELRALQVDYARGETDRSPASALTGAGLARDWLAHLDTRVGHRDARRRYAARTVALYRQRLEQHSSPSSVIARSPTSGSGTRAGLSTASARSPHDMTQIPCLAPGERVRLIPTGV